MSNNYFSPNSKITGGAAFFSFNSKDGCVYVKLLKQIANNQDKKGNFDGANPINIKLGQDEVADIIRSIRTNGEAKFYHQFKETTTSGSFKFYTIPANGNFPAKNGFGLSVKKVQGENNTEIKVGFTLASAERLSLFLQNALFHVFEQEHRDDIQKAKEYSKKRESTNKEDVVSNQEQPSENQQEQEPSF